MDQNGNLKVPGTVTANAADVSGAVTAGAVIVQGIDPATGLVKKVTIGGGSTPGSVYADSGIFANPNAAGVGLGITGTANFGSDVNVNGQTNLQTLNAGQTTLRGYVDMYQSAQIRGGLSVSNNIAANGMISTDGDIVAHGTA